jgi:hypothetical protein
MSRLEEEARQFWAISSFVLRKDPEKDENRGVFQASLNLPASLICQPTLQRSISLKNRMISQGVKLA